MLPHNLLSMPGLCGGLWLYSVSKNPGNIVDERPRRVERSAVEYSSRSNTNRDLRYFGAAAVMSAEHPFTS
jgi:hypothetical protein